MNELNKKEFGTRNTGMFVPEGFFEEFQKNLEKQIDLVESKRNRRHILLRRWSVAASVCLLIGLTPLAWKFFSNPSQEQPRPVSIAEFEAEVEPVMDINTEEIMVSTISDLDIYENFYANL